MIDSSPVFSRVQLTRRYEEVARQIQQAIIDQRLNPGEKLPSQIRAVRESLKVHGIEASLMIAKEK